MERHAELTEERERLERARAGITTAALMAAQGAKKKDGTVFSATDIFPDLEEPVDEVEDAEHQLAVWKTLALWQNARVDGRA